jgi:hypothetical protein
MKEEEHFEDQDVDDKNRNLDFNEIWLDIFVCIYLTQDREKWSAAVCTVLNIWVPLKFGKFLR